jgi:hypothetical protein
LLTHPTLDQLGQLGLPGMAEAFAELEASGEAAALSHADWLGLLLDRELTHRRDKRLAARLRYADCASRPASKTLITEPRAASTARCSTSSPMPTGSTRTTI